MMMINPHQVIDEARMMPISAPPAQVAMMVCQLRGINPYFNADQATMFGPLQNWQAVVAETMLQQLIAHQLTAA